MTRTWLIHDVADINDEGWILANASYLPDQPATRCSCARFRNLPSHCCWRWAARRC